MANWCSLGPVDKPIDSLKSRGGRVLVLGAFFTFFLAVGLQYAFGVIFKALLNDVQLEGSFDRARTGWVSSVSSMLFMLVGIPAAKSNARWGARWTAMAGALLAGTGFLFSSFVPHVLWLFATYSVPVGLGCGLMNHASLYSISVHFPSQRATALGLAMAGGGMGSLVLGPGLESLIQRVGWRGAFMGLAGMSWVMIPLAAMAFTEITLPTHSQPAQGAEHVVASSLDCEPAHSSGASRNCSSGKDPAYKERQAGQSRNIHAADVTGIDRVASEAGPGCGLGTSLGESTLTVEASAGPGPEHATFIDLLRKPDLLAFFAGISLYSGCFYSIILHLVTFASENAPNGPGLSHLEAATLVSYQGIANVIGRLVIGRVADQPGVDRLALQQGLLAAAGAAAAGLSALPTSRVYTTLYSVLFGLCAGSIVATSPSIVATLVPLQALALGLGLNSAVQAPFILILPPLAGLLRERLGSYSMVWGMLSTLMVAGSLVMGPRTLSKMLPVSMRSIASRSGDETRSVSGIPLTVERKAEKSDCGQSA